MNPNQKLFHHWILDKNNKAINVSLIEWAKWFEKNDKRIIKQTRIMDKKIEILVSTIFLGINHNFSGKGKPVLWETMIFNGLHDEYQKRYTSHRLALIGHIKAIKMVNKSIK